MAKPCADCPFSESDAGKRQWDALTKARRAQITTALRHDGHFICHLTARDTGNGSNRLCAGSIAWQEARGLSSQYQRICERLDASRGRR